MTRRLVSGRTAAMGVAAALIFALAGDRGLTQNPNIQGIDPLEVLDLQIKPNVLIVLDSSGSMNNNLAEQHGFGGDYKHSKMGGAKRVLRQVITDNASRVSFMFGQYAQTNSRFNGVGSLDQIGIGNQSNQHGGLGRFSYWLRDDECGGSPCPNQPVNPIYAFQSISATGAILNNLLHFSESSGPTCAVAIAPGFYADGNALAVAMEAAMNGCPGLGNTYRVQWDGTRFTFSRQSGSRNFRMLWGTATNSIRAVLNAGTSNTGNVTSTTTGDARYEVLKRNNLAPTSGGANAVNDTVGGTTFTHHELVAGTFWNGETVYVLANGTVCGRDPIVTPQVPAVVHVQRVTNCTNFLSNATGPRLTFQFAGGKGSGRGSTAGNAGFTGASGTCNGMQIRVGLNACDGDFTVQAANTLTPYLQDVWEYETTPGPNFGQLKRYLEANDGTGRMIDPDGAGPLTIQPPPYGIPANGSTPIAGSLRDLKRVFNAYWDNTQPGAPLGPVLLPPSGTIASHVNPKERTIVLFITDGDDTCAGGSDQDQNALLSASRAQALYQPFVGGVQTPTGDFTPGTDPASSVTTYIVGFGLGASVNRLNWIAWGGSGMQKVSPAQAATGTTWPTPTAADRALCTTCTDAFIAPDADTLATVLNGIFNRGATSGEFTSQGSLIAPVYEYVNLAPSTPPAAPFDARNPSNRYKAITPVRFLSSFTLPGYTGKLQAFVNVGGGANRLWDAGSVLRTGILAGMNACNTAGNAPQVTGECFFSQLHGNATDSNIRTAPAAIKRRIYTTRQNGYFGVTAAQLMAETALPRVALWPPTTSNVDPPNGPGLFDGALGLPTAAALTATDFTNLQSTYRACAGLINATPIPIDGGSSGHLCSSANAPSTRADRARKEARQMILAFMAGAEISRDNSANPKRVASSGNRGEILYKLKNTAVLADSTLATPAVVEPPIDAEPRVFQQEYALFRDGARDSSGVNPGTTGSQIRQGFGLRNPDSDGITTFGNDPRALKPVMTVIYLGANDMLHAFRAGPNVITPGVPCDPAINECGGEELWGFVPFDSLGVLRSRLRNHPQSRDNHDYMVATGLRVADVFVPEPQTNLNVAGVTIASMAGVWRRVLIFGRGVGGKYFSALDITGPGTYPTRALDTVGPIPLWNRGNPDTSNGMPTGSDNNTLTGLDRAAYAKMGETWSLPALVHVDRANHTTVRKPGGVDFVAWVGSGFGDRSGCPLAPCEGTTFYTLDVLTGDVIKAVDVEPVAVANSMGRTGVAYNNAIVASVAGFNPNRFTEKPISQHPASEKATRAYVADLHGRLWKFLASDSSVAIPVADLGVNPDQPVATPVGLLGLPPLTQNPQDVKPHVYAVSGNERRASGPFKAFAFRDDGDDSNTSTSGTVSANQVTTFLPATSLFTRQYDQGPISNAAAPSPHPVFRGTTQPATAFTIEQPPKGVAFLVGTRFNPPGSAFAPVPPPYPCRSTFDSIIYALNADTGTAAYDLNATGDDAYVIFQNSRIAGIQVVADPASATGSSVAKDEGLIDPFQPTPPPPPPGQPPTTTKPDVRPEAKPGQPLPTVRFGSTVCQ